MARKKKEQNVHWVVAAVAITVTLLAILVAHKIVGTSVDRKCEKKLGEGWYSHVTVLGTNACVNEGGEVQSL